MPPTATRLVLTSASLALAVAGCSDATLDQATSPGVESSTRQAEQKHPDPTPDAEAAFLIGRAAFLDGALAGYQTVYPSFTMDTDLPARSPAELEEAALGSATWADDFPEFFAEEPREANRSVYTEYLDAHPEAVAAYGQLLLDFPELITDDPERPTFRDEE